MVYQCRRCNLPIEKQAVSSSDGQLKGKYHRDCFNCHSCSVSSPTAHPPSLLTTVFYRNRSLTRRSTSTTADLTAPTTTTKQTALYVLPRRADSPSKDRVQ